MLFDLRTVIGLLFGIYGVVLTFMGLFTTGQEELDKADGINVNLWMGVAMLVTSALFVAWERLRPVPVEDVEAEAKADSPE